MSASVQEVPVSGVWASSAVLLLSFATVTGLVLVERALLFSIEIDLARTSSATNSVLVLGADSVAAHVLHVMAREPRLRSRIVGFLHTSTAEPDPAIPADLLRGTLGELHAYFERDDKPDWIILTDSSIGHRRILDIIVLCEQNLVSFSMVPDLFRVLTSHVEVATVGDVPLLEVGKWPLDSF